MTKLLRIAIWPAAFVLALALTFGTAAALGQEAKPRSVVVGQEASSSGPITVALGIEGAKPAEPPKPAPKVVALTTGQILEQALLEQQAENLRLRVCSDAGINWRVCEVRWRDRVAVDTSTLPKEQPKTQ